MGGTMPNPSMAQQQDQNVTPSQHYGLPPLLNTLPSPCRWKVMELGWSDQEGVSDGPPNLVLVVPVAVCGPPAAQSGSST